jgi:hypothetical protein
MIVNEKKKLFQQQLNIFVFHPQKLMLLSQKFEGKVIKNH